VTFLGLLDRRDALPDLYANCDAFVFASVTETLGLVVLEAMASGLPVIAAPEGGVRDHLRDGINGLAYDAGDSAAMARAMVLLVGEWELSRRLARQARRTAEGLSWESELDRLDASYRQVVAGGPAVSLQPVGKDARDRCAAAPLALGVHPASVRLDEMLHDGEA
jgi:glycosyltransferase involved in cell wall biosynthesis